MRGEKMRLFYKPRLYTLISYLPEKLKPLYAEVYNNCPITIKNKQMKAFQKIENLFGNFYIAFNSSDIYWVFCFE